MERTSLAFFLLHRTNFDFLNLFICVPTPQKHDDSVSANYFLKCGATRSYGYILDIDRESFSDKAVLDAILHSSTLFVNAVMGFTPHFYDGSQALDETIDRNTHAKKRYGGGDAL